MRDHVPTVRARHLGNQLRLALESSGMKAVELCELVGWSASKVSRMLSGKRPAERAHVAAFLALCGVRASHWDGFLDPHSHAVGPWPVEER